MATTSQTADQAPRVAILVTRRPEWVTHGLATASRLADITVYRFHESGRFSDVFNDALQEARNHAPMAMKIDDHDTYPETYDLIDRWKPGACVWGEVEVRGCDGSFQGRGTSMCATVFGTDLELMPDKWGMLTASLRAQTSPIVVKSGVVKTVCPGEWSWGARPGSHRAIDCNHALRPLVR